MCFHVISHHTSSEHDTRFLSIINPVTGYTVYSPFQEPYTGQRCTYPHIVAPIHPVPVCPWHPGCCRLTENVICHGDPNVCATRVRYHHYVDEEKGEINDLSFLHAYLSWDPSNLLIPAWFFKAGVELGLADMYKNQTLRRLDQLNGAGLYAAERASLEPHLARYSNMLTCAQETLGQFARLWDEKSEQGFLPPRPGKHPDPVQNVYSSAALNLRVGTWAKTDTNAFPWPQLVELWPRFRAGLLRFEDDPAILPLVGSTRMSSNLNTDALFSNLSLDSPYKSPPIDPRIFNPAPVNPLPFTAPPTQPLLSSPPLRYPVQERQFITPTTQPAISQYSSMSSLTTLSSASPSPFSSPPLSSVHSSHPLDTESESEAASTIFVSLSGSSESETTEGAESLGTELDEGQVFAIEALVGHRPPGASRSRVVSYRVRWEGDWPPRQKETWQRERDIAPCHIEEYWKRLSDAGRSPQKRGGR
ncbi:hypothetical protein GGR54DRAFT_201814 [Hypoxylon sp. NC1633]|nr:hypothetical protein GGR54DRAFT_201814 [Hypoxylon sp. NC1633]